jgi:hypothetical protein
MLLPAKTGSWLKLTLLGITVSRYHDFLIAPDALSVITFLGSAAGLARARERLQEYGNSITSPSKALWCDLNRFIPCPFPHGSQYLAAIPVRKVLRTMLPTLPKIWKTTNCRQWVSYCNASELGFTQADLGRSKTNT